MRAFAAAPVAIDHLAERHNLTASGLAKRAVRNNPQKAEPGDKAKERLELKAQKEAEAAEAAAAAGARTHRFRSRFAAIFDDRPCSSTKPRAAD